MQATAEGKALGLDLLSRDRLKQLGTNGIQIPITKQGDQLVGTKRAYEDELRSPGSPPSGSCSAASST